MTKRYADRYFGPGDGTGAEAPSWRADTHQVPRPAEEADWLVAGPGEKRPRPAPAWRSRWRVAVSIAAAFAVGIGAGAYGLERHRTSETLAAARANVDLTAAITYLNRFRDRVEIGVAFTNHGPYRVTAGPPDFVDPAMNVEPGGGVAIGVEPGATAARTLTASINCPPNNPNGTWAPDLDLAATVTTVDGVARRTELPIDESSISVASDLARICGAMALAIGDLYFYVTAVGTTPEGSVTSQLVLADAFEVGRFDPSSARAAQVYLNSVQTGYGARIYRVTTTPSLPAVLYPGTQLSVRWDVADCERAASAGPDDMRLSFSGHVNDGPVGVAYLQDPTVNLAAALVRMAFVRCGSSGSDAGSPAGG